MDNRKRTKELDEICKDLEKAGNYILDRMNQRNPKLTIDVYWAAIGLLELRKKLKGDRDWTQSTMGFLMTSGDPTKKKQ